MGMTPSDLLLNAIAIASGVVLLVAVLNRFASRFMGNAFPEQQAKKEREKVLVHRIEELERAGKWREEDLNRQIKELQLTVSVLTRQADENSDRVAELKARIADLEKELANMQGRQERADNRSKARGITVLGIWPVAQGQPALDQTGEADALYDAGYTYVALRGPRATRSGVIYEIDRVRPTILQVGGHGDKDGIMLSDGISEAGWWAELLSGRDMQLVVLMSCDSSQQDEYNVSDALIRANVRAVISCDDKINDADAVRFTQLLYAKMNEGSSLSQAVQRAKLSVPRRSAEMIRFREANK
jgi:hypothetical protein